MFCNIKYVNFGVMKMKSAVILQQEKEAFSRMKNFR